MTFSAWTLLLSHCKSLIHLPPSFCCIRISSKRSLVTSALYLWMAWLYLKKMGIRVKWYVLLAGNLEITNYSHSVAPRYRCPSKVLQWHSGECGLSDLLLLPSNGPVSLVSCLIYARFLQTSRISSDLSNDMRHLSFFFFFVLNPDIIFLIPQFLKH